MATQHSNPEPFATIGEFYPYYLTQHLDATCRALHLIGTTIVVGMLVYMFVSLNFWIFPIIPVVGYGFAWVGHFVFERNKPAAFKRPLWSLGCDFIMLWHFYTNQLPNHLGHARAMYPKYVSMGLIAA